MIEVGREYIDDLTGLYNRRFLRVKSGEYFQIIDREASPTSILLIDLDHFKNINDTYGHSKGDTVLVEFSSFLEDILRSNDSVFRYGGDEFVCVLPGTGYEQAERISHRFIEKCREKEFSRIRLTMSIGIASCPDDGKDWVELFDTADQRLYSAKRHGRDRIGTPETGVRNLIIPTKEIVGRNDEFSEVMRYAESSSDIQGGTFCISGEIGVGKSRFVREIIDSERFRPFRFLGSMLSATTHSIPYFPFRELIRSIVRMSDGLNLEDIPQTYRIELTKIVPELSDYLAESAGEVLMVDKFRLFEGVRRLLEQQVATGPLIISLDNIHWADEGSLELLHYIIRAFHGSPILFLLIYRVEEAGKECFQRVLNNMSREGLFSRITLEPLGEADLSRMLSMIIDRIPSHSLTGYIYRKTGGNPFFVEELMKSLHESGALYWNSDSWKFREEMADKIPHSIEDVIDRKLGLMSAEARSLMEHAAVIGREFDFGFLLEMTEWNEGQLFDIMDEILGMRFLSQGDEESFRFKEDIIREIICSRMNESRKRKYHLDIGEKLLKDNKDYPEKVAEELAFHFHNGGDQLETVHHSIIAGNSSRDSYANQDAIRFYTWAAEILEMNSENMTETLVECLKERAGVYNLVGDNEKAIEDISRAIEYAGETGNSEKEADCLVAASAVFQDTAKYLKAKELSTRALEIYRNSNNRSGEAQCLMNIGTVNRLLGKYNEALDFFRQSLDVSCDSSDHSVEIKTLTGLGTTYAMLGEYDNALEHYHASRELSESTGSRKSHAAILNNIGNICYLKGDYSKALECYNQSMETNREIGNRRAQASILNNMAGLNYKIGNYAKALNSFREAQRISSDIGDRKAEAATLNNIGTVQMHLGNNKDAIPNFINSLDIRKEIGDRSGEAEGYANIGAVRQRLGEYAEAHEFFEHSLRIREEISDREGHTKILCNIGCVFLEENERVRAEAYFRMAETFAREIGSKPLLAWVLVCRAQLSFEEDDPAGVKRYLDELETHSGEFESKEISAEILLISSRLFTFENKTEDAKSCMKQSIESFEALGDDYLIARVLYYKGLMQKESGRKSDADASFQRAGEIFTRIEANGWLARLGSNLES